MQSGKFFEEVFLENFASSDYSFRSFRKASEKEDREEGTDFFCGGLRFDITEDFCGKDNLTLKAGIHLPNFWVELGIRTGNQRVTFREPVVVLGIQVPSCTSKKEIVRELSNHWSELFGKSFDLWCAYDDMCAKKED